MQALYYRTARPALRRRQRPHPVHLRPTLQRKIAKLAAAEGRSLEVYLDALLEEHTNATLDSPAR
jgi:hypothetical protein